MGGAVSVIASAGDEDMTIIDFDGVKSLLDTAWCEEVESKLNDFNENKTDTQINQLNKSEVQQFLTWLEGKGIITKDKLDEFLSSLAVTPPSADNNNANPSLKESATRLATLETGDQQLPTNDSTSETNNSVITSDVKEVPTTNATVPNKGPPSMSKAQSANANDASGAGGKKGGKKGIIDRDTLPSTALRCVSLSFLLRFTDHYKLWHHKTRDVVSQVIVPLSKQQQCVWSDLDPSVSLLEPQDIAPPQIFVSHAWTNSWGLLVLAVQAYAKYHKVKEQKLVCWIDIFVINQHNYMQELKQLDRVIEVCGNFIQVIDSESAVPLGRVWCLYEVMARLKYKTKKGNLTVTVASITPPSDNTDDQNLKDDNTSTPPPTSSSVPPSRPELVVASQQRIDAVLKNVDMERAQASYPEDVEKILNLVRTEIPGGFKTVNAQVKDALINNSVQNMFESAAAGAAGTNKGGKKGKKKGGKSSLGGGHNISDLYAGLE